MKKLLGILVLGLLWCNVSFALSQSNAIDNFFSERKLHKSEGIWGGKGIVEAYVKNGNQLRTIRISGGRGKSGATTGVAQDSGNFFSGTGKTYYRNGKFHSNCSLIIEFHSSNSGSWQCEELSASLTRIWPSNLESHNAKFGDSDLEKLELASMIDKAKDTCKSLGFKPGTEKFADCSLKLYTQRIELAAQNNQTVVMQPQSSGSNTMTIYDPVRDNQRLIDQGMKMITGRCTVGFDC